MAMVTMFYTVETLDKGFERGHLRFPEARCLDMARDFIAAVEPITASLWTSNGPPNAFAWVWGNIDHDVEGRR